MQTTFTSASSIILLAKYKSMNYVDYKVKGVLPEGLNVWLA
jgi:hypothetical protein